MSLSRTSASLLICCNFAHVYDAAEAFFEYLTREFKILGEVEDDHVTALSYSLYLRVRTRFFDSIVQTRAPDPHRVFRDTLNYFIRIFESFAYCDCYYDLVIDDF
jgi:hypothetical protein